MRLNIPAQNEPTSSSSPNAPRKLKKMLADFPNANMGELTRQTFELLRDQNRQIMPAKNRLENLEMLNSYTREIFDSLKKYFINRTLPLPDKSQKIVTLNQSILQELVYGYEIIAQQAADDSDRKIDDKTLSAAIYRALSYLSEMLLRSSEVYATAPKNLWHDAHQLYLLAENRGLTEKAVSDPERNTKTSITDRYKQLTLFALARPIALRQSDCDRVYKELFDWCQYADLKQEVTPDMVGQVFSLRMDEDSAPDYLDDTDLTDDMTLRAIDVSRLVEHIKALLQKAGSKKLVVGDEIPPETLETLINSLSDNAERRFNRAERQGHINVAIGLSKICKAIAESLLEREQPPESEADFFRTSSVIDNDLAGSAREFFKAAESESSLTLESIDDDKRDDGYMTMGDSEENEWDMVAKGRVLTDSYVKQKELIDEEELEDQRQHSDSHWDIVNISAGGYCLHWNSDDTSTAQIGELIALQEFDREGDFTWHVGAIRWMQFTQQNGLEIGVQILSPRLEAVTVQRANRLDEAPFDCLMLPEIKAIRQEESLLLPSHAFKSDNKLVIRAGEEISSVTLGEIKEQTGSFTQFAYLNTELDKKLKKQLREEANKDDFDELWSSL